MRIIFRSPLPPYRGGIAQFGARLLTELRKLGAETIPWNYSRLYPGILFPGSSQLDRGEERPAGPLHGYDPRSWLKARRLAGNSGADIILSQWWHPFFAPALTASAPRSIPGAAICHNVMPHEGMPFSSSLAGMFLSRQKLLAVHSEGSAEEAARFSGKVLKLFHPVYDQYLSTGLSRENARRSLGLSERSIALLFFGLVRNYKGFDILLEAMDQLPEKYVLLAAGEDYTGRKYHSKRLIRHEGFVPDSQVGTWFNAADIVVLPYRSASQSGIAQIALAFGKPMVVTPVGGLPEVVDHGITGTVSASASPGDLAGAVAACSEFAFSPETRRAIAEKAAGFSWSAYASKLLEALS